METKIKQDLAEERKQELRKVEQRRQAKIEQRIKEQMHKPQKQSSLIKKKKGMHKLVRPKDWKRVRAMKQIDPHLTGLQ